MLLILASPHVLLEPSGRERGRSIPFATVGEVQRHVRSWVNSGSGWAANIRFTKFNRCVTTSPKESSGVRSLIPNLVLRLCFEVADVMAFVQLI